MQRNLFHRNTAFFVMMFIFALAATARISPAQTKTKEAPEIHVCGLLTAEDVAPIVGVRQPSQETKGGSTCMWGDPSNDPNKPRLLIQAPSFDHNDRDPLNGVGRADRDRLESSFKANRKQAFDDKNNQAKDEPQLGKFAFSALTEDGVEIIVLKKNSLLNVRMLTGKRGTPENVDAIRKVTAKVSASF